MKIEVYTICYNEEVLMPYFLRHYSTFCDKITIYDNYSTDKTIEIAKSNPKVIIIPYESGNTIRDDIYREIKNNCWKGSKADWVIVVDMDEFIYIPHWDPSLSRFSIIEPSWWEMISDHLPTTEGQLYSEINQGVYSDSTKRVMFAPKSIQSIGYEVGAHKSRPKGDIRIIKSPSVYLLHYKMLSLEYYLNRTALLSSRLSELNKQKKWGYHYNFSQESIIQFYNDCWRDKKPIPV